MTKKTETADTGTEAVDRQLILLEGFATKTRLLNSHLGAFDLYGMTSDSERERFWEQFFILGEDVTLAFREIVALHGGSARDRILRYLTAHVGEVVEGTTLASVAGISEWARRVRELDGEKGYRISTRENDPKLRPSQYRLEAREPDLARAEWWRLKKSLRDDQSICAPDKLLRLRSHPGRPPVTKKDLEYVAGSSWEAALDVLKQAGFELHSDDMSSGWSIE